MQYIYGHTQAVLDVGWVTAPGCPLSTCATASADHTVKLWALKRVDVGTSGSEKSC